MNSAPYQIDKNSVGRKLEPIDPAKANYPETWLQELLSKYPAILPTAEIEPVFSPLVPIGREVPTSAGFIDNLFISPQGYPVLVETKLWRNPEARRDVIAQSIDYAASITSWKFDKLDEVTRKYTLQREGKAHSLTQWIEEYTHESLEDIPYFEETVSNNLRLGRFLMLLVGDRIRSTVVDMLIHINQYPHLAMNIGLIELQCYQVKENEEWPMIVVPSLLARTEIIERSIVQVDVSLDGSYQVKVEQQDLTGGGKEGRSHLTEDEYWKKLKHQAPESYESARKLINYYRDKDEAFLRLRDNSIAVRMIAPESEQKISLFFIRTDGVVECWHASIREQLEKAGLDLQLLKEYMQDLTPILRQRTKKLSIYYPVKNVDVDAFKEAVDRFIDRVIQAEPD